MGGDALNPKSFRQTNMVLSSHLEGQARLQLVINTIPWLFSFPTRFFFLQFSQNSSSFLQLRAQKSGYCLAQVCLAQVCCGVDAIPSQIFRFRVSTSVVCSQ